MRRVAPLAAVALVLVACGQMPPPQPTPASSATRPSAATSASVMPSTAPPASPTPLPFAAGSVVQVLVPSLNLRSGPGQDARPLGVVHVGQRMVIASGPEDQEGYRWYEVSRGRAVDGWVAGGTADESYLARVTAGGLAFRYADGQRVGIGLITAAGGEPTIVEGEPARIAWSPDGSQVAFAWRRSSSGPEIFVMAPDGGGRHRVAAGDEFAWSPDSTRIAVPEGEHIIYRSVADGRDVGRLSLAGLHHVRDLAWSPDGRFIALVADGRRTRARDVWVLAADTGIRHRITRHGRHDTPVWAPAANRLVFNGRTGVQISDPFGSEVHLLASGRVSEGSWSPDGLFLLIQRFGGIDSLDLRLLGSGTVASDEGSSRVSGGSWSPDGSRIVFYRSSKAADAAEAWIAEPDGSHPVRVEHAVAPVSWQPLLGSAPAR